MPFVLKRTSDSKYVAQPGSESSYTTKLERARVYPTREAADGDRCVENERVVDVSAIFHTRTL